MAQRSKTRGPAGSRQGSGTKESTGIEWVGGIAPMPAFVSGEGDPYQPEVLFWLNSEGMVLGSAMGKPGEVLAKASDSLRSTIEKPMYGGPHSPARVRVASAELAETLREGHPGIDITRAATPELDEVLESMRDKFADPAESSYLSSGVAPEAVAALFQAAAALFRSQPWKLVPDDQCLFSVTIEQLGLHAAVLSIMGQMEQSFGFVLFAGLDDFEAFIHAADVIERGEEPDIPPHFALTFERGAALAPELRKEISRHRWEVAGANAYPELSCVARGLTARPPTAKEVTLAEVLSRALTHVMAEKTALRKAWNGGEPLQRTLSVPTCTGEVEITLCTPFEEAPLEGAPSEDVLAELAALSRKGGEMDYDTRRLLEGDLMRRFAQAPEGEAFAHLSACELVMDLAANYLGHTVATLRAKELREVLFELIPRKVSMPATEAPGLIEELRAFYRFLKRELGLAQADSCLRVLGGNAAKNLKEAMSDSSNFGLAKSLLMEGLAAGFEVSPASRSKPSKAAKKKKPSAKKTKRKPAGQPRKKKE